MNHQEYHAKFTIKDIEIKTDKNFNNYYLLHFENSNYPKGYAFQNSVEKETLTILDNNPTKFINQRVNISYLLNQTFINTFLQVKSINLIN